MKLKPPNAIEDFCHFRSLISSLSHPCKFDYHLSGAVTVIIMLATSYSLYGFSVIFCGFNFPLAFSHRDTMSILQLTATRPLIKQCRLIVTSPLVLHENPLVSLYLFIHSTKVFSHS